MRDSCRLKPWCALDAGHAGDCAWTRDKEETRKVWERIKARLAALEGR